jgi:hypothetical protein
MKLHLPHLKHHVRHLKPDLARMKSDLSHVKPHVSRMKVHSPRFKPDLSRLKRHPSFLTPDTTRLALALKSVTSLLRRPTTGQLLLTINVPPPLSRTFFGNRK